MKTNITFVMACCACSLLNTVQTAVAQGSLTPPGAPAPTMRSLAQIEPRTPISALPININAPGSYYLTTNLFATNGSLFIGTNSVTIDLNGFGIIGNGIYSGINCASGTYNLLVKNGSIIGCANGVDASVASGATIEDVRASGNSDYGLDLAQYARVTRCTCLSNALTGIVMGANGRAVDCVAAANGSNGINTSDNFVLTGCIASTNTSDNFAINAANGVLEHCTARFSVNGCGFNLAPASGYGYGINLVDCAALGNSLDGIYLFQRATIQNCLLTFNGRAGIHCSYIATVRECTCVNNGMFGVLCDAAGYCYILNNNCSYNGLLAGSGNPTNGAGIFVTNGSACRIEGNMANLDYNGLVVAAGNSAFIARNTASGNVVSNFVFGTGNSWGPIVNVVGAGSIASTANANYPDANFIH